MNHLRLNRYGLAIVALLLASVCVPGTLLAAGSGQSDTDVKPWVSSKWSDEPEGLNWEFFADDLWCFQDYQSWLSRQSSPAAIPAAEAAPQTVSAVWIQGQALVGDQARNNGWIPYNLAGATGGKVAQLAAGHNPRDTQILVDVPKAGRYRLWTRYWDPTGGNGSFSISILPSSLYGRTYNWENSDQGTLFAHKFDFVPFRLDNDYFKRVQERKISPPSQFVWESAPMVDLPAGKVCLQINGLTHTGPYQPRYVDWIVLTQDPLYEPHVKDAPAKATLSPWVAAVDVPVSEATRHAWGTWESRPGVQPPQDVTPALAKQWRDWRSDLIQRLVPGKSDDAHLDDMAQEVYFNREWNLIGTPAQVDEQIKKLIQSKPKGTYWYQKIEAEDMKSPDNQWVVAESSDASGGKFLRATYSDGAAKATTTIDIPHDGEYVFWIRQAHIHGFYNIFQAHLSPVNKSDASAKSYEFTYGDNKDLERGGYRYDWYAQNVALKKGKYNIELTKGRGKGPYAYRMVDAFVLTDNTDWKPEGTVPIPLGDKEARHLLAGGQPSAPGQLGVWEQTDTWNGFSMTQGPQAGDTAPLKTLTYTLAQGQVASILIHVRNLTDEPVTFTPKVTGDLAGALDWRVVGYLLSKSYSWQPFALMARRDVTAPVQRNVSLWLTLDARDLSPGVHQGQLVLGSRQVPVRVTVQNKGYDKTPVPLVGGFASPYDTAHSWKMFTDVGFTLIHGKVVPADQAKALGIRLFNVSLGIPKDQARVQQVQDVMKKLGLTHKQWSWFLFDEPGPKAAPRWIDGAKKIREWGPGIQIWVNPGERQKDSPAAIAAMAPYIDVFCPYINHFIMKKDPEYTKLIMKTGSLRIYYTTPCFQEKAPNAPMDMLNLGRRATELGRDGWDFYTVKGYYDYATGPWDDINAPFPDQAVSIYPGAHGRSISTRNLEGVREAVQEWRAAHLKK